MKILVGVLLLLSSCNMEPLYERPCLDLPASWRVDSSDASTCANIQWWKSLNDPVLNSLIDMALQNNKDLKVAMWRVSEFMANYQVVRSQLFPQLGLDASAVKERLPAAASLIPGASSTVTPFYSWDFNISWELDFWGKVRSASHAAYDQFLAQVENRRTVVLTLVSRVASSYLLLRQLDLQLEIAKKTLQSRQESLELATDRFVGGLTSEIEVTQAASAYEEAQVQINQLSEQIPQQENLLSILLGKSPGPIMRGSVLDQFPMVADVPSGLPSDLLTNRPDILKAEEDLKAALANVGVAKASFFPQFSLTGIFGAQSFELNNLFTSSAKSWQYGASLFQPLFTGGQLTGQLNSARAASVEAYYSYQQTVLSALREVNDALIAHKQAKELIIIQRNRTEDLKEYLHLSSLRYYEGQTDYLTVLDAERQVFASELDLAAAKGNALITFVDLYKALGGGWVIDADQYSAEEAK